MRHSSDDVRHTIALDEPSDEFRLSGNFTKNHNGARWRGQGRRRHFLCVGFHVSYLSVCGAFPHACGAFDLRNVRCIRFTADEAAPAGSIELVLREPRLKPFVARDKRLILSLPADSRGRGAWLRHLCSAVSEDALVADLRGERIS